MSALLRLREFLHRRRDMSRAWTDTWPDDGSWIETARSCPGFHLDVGYAVTSYVPGWMLAVDARDDPPILLPAVPQECGHVLTTNAIGHEAELLRYFSQLPRLPDPTSRRETAAFSSLAVNVLIGLPEEPPILVDMFAGSRLAALALLDVLTDTAGSHGVIYDNLDQGWALRIQIEDDAVLVLEWDWDTADRRKDARALRFPRTAVAVQAAAARRRLDHLHATLIGELASDLWTCRSGSNEQAAPI